MGTNKTLVIQMNEEETERSTFEQVAHLYSFCKTNLDKFILLFTLLKLAIVEGKTLIMVDDII